MLTIGVIGTKLRGHPNTDVVDAQRQVLSALTTSLMSTHSMSVAVLIARPGDQSALGGEDVRGLGARAEIARDGVERAARVDAGHARDLAGRLGRAVHHVDAATEVEDAHHDEHERDHGEGELDE